MVKSLAAPVLNLELHVQVERAAHRINPNLRLYSYIRGRRVALVARRLFIKD